jgi:tetratricopeptide (TPR) repeat protein
LGKKKEEISALKSCVEIKPEPLLLHRLFELQKNSSDIEGARETVNILRKIKETPELKIAEAKLLNLLGKKDEALQLADKLLDDDSTLNGSLELWVAIHLGDRNDPEMVIKRMEPMVGKGKKFPSIYVALARALHRMEKYQEAVEYLKKAINVDDKQQAWWYDLALQQRQSGLIEDSQKSLEHVIDLSPLTATGLRVFGAEHKFTVGDKMFNRLHYAHAFMERFPDDKKVEMYFALAKAFEDIGELATAFKHYENAGKLQTKLTPYRHSSAASLMKLTRTKVGRTTYANFKEPRSESDKPVFVLGMPRSGTTLTEQLIATHPEAYGAGELKLLHRVIDGISINNRAIETKSDHGAIPTFIPGVNVGDCKKLSFKERGELYDKAISALAKANGKSNVKRVVDKMPGNYFWAGVIPFILPNAKIVHTQRHPLDNCLSVYRIFFPDGMPWSYDLTNLGKVYRAYYEHMTYWETALPENMMITVNYEVLIADFENQAKRIINHVGLPWDEACLKFHENDRQVKTASLNQVRKPIYNTSVGRWKKYEEYLKPLIKELGPLITEYEDKIQAQLKNIK